MAVDPTRFAAARLWAATRTPYLASALFACTPVSAPGSRTIAADRGWRIHVDPDVAAGLDAPQLGRLLIHLAGHLVRDHADRATSLGVDEGRAGWWRRCSDAEINDDLAAADLLPPVANDLPAGLGAPDGRLAETYFAMEPSGPPSWDCGSGSDGVARRWDGDALEGGLSGDEAERVRHGVAADIRRAHEREPGSLPGGWLRWAESVRRSRTDWRRVLGAEIRRAVAMVAGSVDYTYRRPSRRSHGSPGKDPRAILPSLYRPLPEVAIVCDTSGSMDGDLLAQVLAEVDAIVARAGLRAGGVSALAVDTDVQARRRVRTAADVPLTGGGGTDMRVGIEAALRQRPRPEVVIVLTDGFTPWPETQPRGVRLIVGVLTEQHGSGNPPPSWARTVEIQAQR